MDFLKVVFTHPNSHKENHTVGSITHCTLGQFQMYPRFKCTKGNHTSRKHGGIHWNFFFYIIRKLQDILFLDTIQNLKTTLITKNIFNFALQNNTISKTKR